MPGNSINTSELKAALTDPKVIAAHSFEILQSLCCLSGINEQEEAQDMLLRALEMREYFICGQEILDGLTRKFGLFPYLSPETLSFSDQIAYEVHRPDNMEPEITFHRPQAEVYWTVLEGENVVLSAPTSFGKSLIIDAIVASGRFKNILIVVPTIALIDETRKRLAKRFRGKFKVITHGSQAKADRNIFVATQERVLQDSFGDDIDFFIIDEFYKLSPRRGEDDRSSLLNQVVYNLLKKKRQFYMLGPNVQGVSPDFGRRVKYKMFLQPYRTVVSELRYVEEDGDEFERLLNLCKTLNEPTLIFCRSPARARDVATRLIEAGFGTDSVLGKQAADWVSQHYHSDWHFTKALRLGIGIHHGRIPRALAQFVVHAFDTGEIRFLICTSTLIEGVNTKAKNIIIFDHVINRTPIDLFTFNNIRGRAGRMKEHFVGHVYLFHPEPEQQLPFVDMPVFEQSEDAPDSLLIQIDDNDLTSNSRERMNGFLVQDVLDYATLQANVGLDPQRQINMAREIKANIKDFAAVLQWDGLPTAYQVQQICGLLWRHFDGRKLGGGGVHTDRQLAYLINSLRSAPSIKSMIDSQVSYWGADMAVQITLDFLRLWANFHFPRLLRGLDRIQKDLFRRAGHPSGDYDYFANKVEHYFLDAGIVALDEYGIPLEVARKLQNVLASGGNLDDTLAKLNSLDVERTNLTSFEKALVEEAQSNL
jgi:hypothetical protein